MTWAGAVPGCRNAATEISRSRIMVSMRRRGWSSPVPESLPESVRHVPLHEHVCGALLHRLRSAVHTIVSDLRLSALQPSALCRETRWPSALSAGPLQAAGVWLRTAPASLKHVAHLRVKPEHGPGSVVEGGGIDRCLDRKEHGITWRLPSVVRKCMRRYAHLYPTVMGATAMAWEAVRGRCLSTDLVRKCLGILGVRVKPPS